MSPDYLMTDDEIHKAVEDAANGNITAEHDYDDVYLCVGDFLADLRAAGYDVVRLEK